MAFVGWAGELRLWVAHVKNLPNLLCQTAYTQFTHKHKTLVTFHLPPTWFADVKVHCCAHVQDLLDNGFGQSGRSEQNRSSSLGPLRGNLTVGDQVQTSAQIIVLVCNVYTARKQITKGGTQLYRPNTSKTSCLKLLHWNTLFFVHCRIFVHI